MSDGAKLTIISDVDQDKQMFGSHERSLTYTETSKLQNINPIYLNAKFTFGIIQIITNACQVLN